MRSVWSIAVVACAGIFTVVATAKDCVAQVGTAAASPTSWTIDRKPDPITGAGANAWVMATRVTVPPGKFTAPPAALQLLCFKNEPVVRLRFAQKVGSNRSASLAYRFDEKPGHEANGRVLPDFKTVVIEDRSDVAKCVKELASANEVIVSVNSLIVGKTNPAFPVRGAPAAIAEAFAQCPLQSPKRKTSQVH